MDPNEKCVSNDAVSSTTNAEAQTGEVDTQDLGAETNPQSDVDQEEDQDLSEVFSQLLARCEPKPTLEYFNNKLDLITDSSVMNYFNRVLENLMPINSILYFEILTIINKDYTNYKERVDFVISHARTQYDVLDAPYIEGYLKLMIKELNLLGEIICERTKASIAAIELDG